MCYLMVLSHFFSLFFLLLFFNCLLCSLWKFKEQKVMSLWSDKWCRVLRVWQIRIFLSPELLFASVISWVRALGALGAISLVDLFLLYHRGSLRTFSCLPSILSYTHLPTHSSSSYVPPPLQTSTVIIEVSLSLTFTMPYPSCCIWSSF